MLKLVTIECDETFQDLFDESGNNVNLNNPEDSELIRSSQQGDLQAFNALVERYQQQTLKIAYRMLGNLDDAEDVCQNSWLSAWKSIRDFRGGNFKAWIFRILANNCKNEYGKRKRKLDISVPDFVDRASDNSVDDQILTREKMEAVQLALLQLPHDLRLAVTLREFGGLSYEEIAGVMNCSVGTVKSRLNRGRITLRDILKTQDII